MIRRVFSISIDTFRVNPELYAIPVLLNVDQVPDDLKEIAIIRGYRTPINSPYQCLASVFHATNETLNFWTHFIPTWYFIYRLTSLRQTFSQDAYSLPLLSFLIISCVYPFTSCTAHVFSSLSQTARHICYFCDYGALSLYSYGAAVLYRTYSLPDQFLIQGLGDYYLLASFLTAAISTLVACSSRFSNDIAMTIYLRIVAFGLPYFCGGLPVLYRVFSCLSMGDECNMLSFPHHASHSIIAVMGGIAYGAHLPERFAPGLFDIIGHSHQWLHIASVLTTNEQIMAALLDMQQRRSFVLSHGWTSTTHVWICGSVFLLFVWSVVVVSWFSIQVLKKEKRS